MGLLTGAAEESRQRFARMHWLFFVFGVIQLIAAIVVLVVNVEAYEAVSLHSEPLHPASILVVPGALVVQGAFWLTISWLAERLGRTPGFAIRAAPAFSPLQDVTEPRLAAPIRPR